MNKVSRKAIRTILVIDDEESMHDSCMQIFEREGYTIISTYTGDDGMSALRERKPDIVLLDIKLPSQSGINILRHIAEIDPTIVTVVITGYATIETAVDVMKFGASDFLPKPFTPDELRLIVNRAIDKRDLLVKTRNLEDEKNRIKENFVSIITHEMRSPLVAVEQYIQVLLNDIAGELLDKQRDILTKCNRRIGWLLCLVNEWLSMARIKDTLYLKESESVVIQDVLSEAFELVRIQAEEKNISPVSDIPDSIVQFTGNHEALIHLFMNLYSNAIKYNREGGKIVTEAVDIGDSIQVTIWDTGIGIPEEDLPFIFDEFYRVRRKSMEITRSSQVTGTGLGLAIVKKIIDAHGGYIKFESQEDVGTTVTIYLPKEQRPRAQKSYDSGTEL